MPAPPSPAPPALLTDHAERLAAIPGGVTDLVLVLRSGAEELIEVANAYADRWPRSRILVLSARRIERAERSRLRDGVTYRTGRTLQSRVDALLRTERPQAIVAAGGRDGRLELDSLQELFGFLTPGGCYVVDGLDRLDVGANVLDGLDGGDPGADALDLLTELAAVTVAGPAAVAVGGPSLRGLAGTTAGVRFAGSTAVVRRGGERMFVALADGEVDDVLTARYGDDWGRAVVAEAAAGSTQLRRYRDVVCSVGGIVRYGDYLLPTGRDRGPGATDPILRRGPGRLTGYTAASNPTSYRRVPGTFFHLEGTDDERELTGRLQGWTRAVAEDPGVRPLLGVDRPDEAIPEAARELLRGHGVDPADALLIAPDEAVEVETLYVATTPPSPYP